ncbi:MAG: 4Fe-4S binding protein [bacterium]|nr:4Fe-4S binding protein [bacterium]
MANLAVELFGIRCAHPVWAAAGPNVLDGAHALRAAQGGASALVMKTISTEAARVPKPCMARVGADALVNCELWSELAAEEYLAKEYALAKSSGVPVIASIGYRPEELAELGPRVEATGCVDAIEFSLHYTGRGHEEVLAAARALRAAVRLPIIAKLSPGMGDLGEVAEALEPYVDAFAAINSVGPVWVVDTERGRPLLGSEDGRGWLSGRPIKPIALRCVREVASRVKVPVIGVGGIVCGQDAIEFLMAGAWVVQVCTAAILRGPQVYGAIAREMAEWMEAHGYTSVEEVRARGRSLVCGMGGVDYAGQAPQVDEERCTRCGLCVTSCCPRALTLKNEGRARIEVDTALCVRCGLCRTVCPHGAIT